MNPVNFDARQAVETRERLHAIVAKATDGSKRPLWRLDGDRLYVVGEAVDADRLSARLGNANVHALDFDKHLDRSLTEGAVLQFSIEANLARTETIDGRKRIHSITDPQQKIDWLRRKISDMGATVTEAHITGHTVHQFEKKDGTPVTFGSTTYMGRLTVHDPLRLRAGVLAGIGRSKAYGMGLLILW